MTSSTSIPLLALLASTASVFGPASALAGTAIAVPAPSETSAPLVLVRRGRGADDGPSHDAGDDHGGRGADDGAMHDAGDDHGRGRGADDGAGHDAGDDHGGGVADDGSAHDARDDRGHDRGHDHGLTGLDRLRFDRERRRHAERGEDHAEIVPDDGLALARRGEDDGTGERRRGRGTDDGPRHA